ncbi:hypothetical protein [Breznakiella homolactica]|uniref:Uncharacterized protein n=1 Tax=Breznakiella homolactica TaxID=2798577 RepID=A0A7T7XQ97_9SPIR|nr:hypothetical protein [Breznakiella homolactica]QQO10525.1 hypothetical protein JFL75_06315 [Breznakiella homolactica]
MRPIDHFFSQLSRVESSFRDNRLTVGQADKERLAHEFSRLIAPVIGSAAAEDTYFRTLERISGRDPASLRKLGYLAAFFLGEYDDGTMELDTEDWREIRETLEDASGAMDLDTLTGLMGELLSRGILN